MKICINCNKESGDFWETGELCVFGTFFACSHECAVEWAEKGGIRPGYRPGEPMWEYDVHNQCEHVFSDRLRCVLFEGHSGAHCVRRPDAFSKYPLSVLTGEVL